MTTPKSAPTAQQFIIPCELPALNQTIEAGKRHWSEYAVLKRRYTALVAALARRQLRPVLSGSVHLSFVWYCRNKRRDPDNVSAAGRKVILDGLVTAGILSNDGGRQVGGFNDSFEVDKDKPRVEVELCYNQTTKT